MPTRRRKVRLARYPFSAELMYRRDLKALVAQVRQVALAEVERNGPLLLDMVAFDDDAPQPIGWAARLQEMLLRIASGVTFGLLGALNRLRDVGRQVDTVNRTEWRAQVRSAFGVDIFAGEPRLPGLISAWEAENVALIRSIPANVVDQLRGEFSRALREGAGLKDLARIVRERTDVADSRATLIAQDQVSKLNGQLAEMRQRSIGVEEFVWRTSQDERVRPAHKALDGKTFRWDKPPSEGRPGQPVRCRCQAEPVFPDEMTAEVRRTG